MSKINGRPVRRTAAGVLASTLMLSGAIATAVPANAAAGFGLDRIAGSDRYETSAAVATAFGPATNVIIASGEAGRSADALGASFLAGVQNAPVLLTRRDTTPEPVLVALRALRTSGATTLTVIGGAAAISAQQLAAFQALGFTTVTRIDGEDRFATAAAVAVAGESATASNIGIIASGVTTIDALAGGPLSYKGKHPIFLTSRTGIRPAVLAALRSTGITSVYILGGEAAVGPQVAAQLTAAGITIAGRLAGADRSATSAAIATALVANFGFDPSTFNLASGANEGIDALSGAALSGKQNRVLLVTNNATSAAPVTAYATANATRLNRVGNIFGGLAAVSSPLELALEAAGGGGTLANGQVTLVSNSVAQGGTVSGNVAGTNVRSVTVSGCGFTNSPVAIGAFSLVIPASQATGTCTLTFTVTDNAGVVTTQTQTVTVTAATAVQGTGTSRPELASATIVQTLAGTGTTIRYTFDEPLTGASVTTADAPFFGTYTFASTGTRVNATTVRVDETDNRSVLATFAGATTTALAAELSVAVVDEGIVLDLQGEGNPIGDAALNPGSVTTPVLAGGITLAPDLVTVGNFRANAADATTTLVDFTFDEAADGVAPTYRLVSTDGITVRTGTAVAGSGTTVHTVSFPNSADATPSTVVLVPSGQARGVVDAGTVNETAAGNLPNVLQAADATGGNTETPDLVSASLIRDASTTAGTRDQVLYTFDEPVLVSAGAFNVYLADATTVPVTATVAAARSTANATQVLVTFGAAANALDNAVGASVGANAVTEAAGSVRPNQADEESLSNIGAPSSTTVSGRTEGPDLTAVSVERVTDAFGTTTGGQVRFTFDEDVFVATADAPSFIVFEADGTRRAGAAAAVGTTEDTDNQVVVTFTGATTDAILRSVLGTVEGDAVANQATGTGPGGTAAAAGTEGNPEGAQLATGSTGTPRA